MSNRTGEQLHWIERR